LIQLLKDPVEKVKQAAVFALGQIGNQKAETALIQSFIAIDSTGPYVLTNAMILEALGKCGGDSTLQLICNISSYTPADSLLVYGQIAALYRFGLREKYCKASEEKFIRVATDNQYPENTRLLAAHGLQRFKAFKLNDYFERLKIACREEKNADIRMCLVSALSRIPGPSTISTLEELYSGCSKKMKVTRKIYDQNGGAKTEEKIITIDVKPGWKAGTKVTFEDMGDKYPNKQAADMVFRIEEKPHAYFTRERNNLVYKADVTLREALCGTHVMISTLSGRHLKVNVKDIISPNYEKRVLGEGMPLSKAPATKGDLIIRFNVRWPSHLNDNQKQTISTVL